MNHSQSPSFDDLLTNYSTQAQLPVTVPPIFAASVVKARQAELARNLLVKRIAAGLTLLILIVAGVVILQPTTVTAKYDRATRQVVDAPYRLSDWNVDVAKLTEQATAPAKGLLSSIQRVTLPITSPDLGLSSSLPKLNGIPESAIAPLTSGPRRAMALFLRDTGFNSH